MKALLIQYIILYSKAGYAPAASILLKRIDTAYTDLPTILDKLQEELAYSGAPTWLFNSLVWHIAERDERMQAGQ